MLNRCWSMTVIAVLLASLPFSKAEAGTDWQFKVSEALDAALLTGILSGDPLANKAYPHEAERWSAKLNGPARAALQRLDSEIRIRGNNIVGPYLNDLVTRGPHRDLRNVIAWLSNKAELSATLYKYWQGAALKRNLLIAADLRIVLIELQNTGFSAHWRENIRPLIEDKIPEMEQHVAKYDIASEVSRFFELPINPMVTVILLHYNQPFGLRIRGQQAYVTNYELSIETTVITAVHEMFHPPFDHSNSKLWTAAANLRADKWMRNIVENHDPQFTYTSFEAVLDEDSTKALDQVVTERLGIAPDPATRWRKQDGGMHMLAAAIYHAMKETGFADTGGSFEHWLIEALTSEILSPEAVRRRAASIVGEEAVARWNPK